MCSNENIAILKHVSCNLPLDILDRCLHWYMFTSNQYCNVIKHGQSKNVRFVAVFNCKTFRKARITNFSLRISIVSSGRKDRGCEHYRKAYLRM